MKQLTANQEDRKWQRTLKHASSNTDWKPYTDGSPAGVVAPAYIGALDWDVFDKKNSRLLTLHPKAVKFADGKIYLTNEGIKTIKEATVC